MTFTAYDYSPGLAMLGQGVNALNKRLELDTQRQTLAALGQKVQSGDYAGAAQAAFQAGDASAGLGILKLGEEAKQRQAGAEASRGLSDALGGGGGMPLAPRADASGQAGAPQLPAFARGDAMGQYASAIQGNESGGRYDIVGPTHPKLGRALGAYQVMEANVAPWTREALGREMTPDEFLKDPAAQDAVFKYKFGQSVEKYGNPQDAASVWFTGRPLAQGANARDVLGTTGQSYVNKFTAGLGGTPATFAEAVPGSQSPAPLPPARGDGGVQVASADPGFAPQMPKAASASDILVSQQQDRDRQRIEASNQGGTTARIGALNKALSNPNLPESARQLGLTYLKDALESTKLTPEQKEFMMARGQGFTGSFMDYKKELKSTGPTILKQGDTVYDEKTNSAKYTAPGGQNQAQQTEQQLRGEADKHLKTFNEVHDAYGRVIAATQQREANPDGVSPASDIGLVFGYMKMLDPGSVVREGEYATAQNAGGIEDKIRNTYNKVLTGQFLTPEQRQDFVDTAGRLYGQSRATAENVANRYGGLATQYGANPDRVVQLPKPLEPPTIGARRGGPTEGGRSGALQPAPAPVLDRARKAIADGAPREAVIDKMRRSGVDPSAL